MRGEGLGVGACLSLEDARHPARSRSLPCLVRGHAADPPIERRSLLLTPRGRASSISGWELVDPSHATLGKGGGSSEEARPGDEAGCPEAPSCPETACSSETPSCAATAASGARSCAGRGSESDARSEGERGSALEVGSWGERGSASEVAATGAMGAACSPLPPIDRMRSTCGHGSGFRA